MPSPTSFSTSNGLCRRSPGSKLRLGVAAVLATVVGVTGAIPAGAAPAPAGDVGASVVVNAAEQAKAAVAKGLDKGPGARAPQGAPYPAQKQALAAAAAARQSGPKLGTEAVEPTEVVGARTRTTRTELDPITGNLRTELSAESLNYQDDAGTWQPIQTALKPAKKAADGSAGGWTNGENRFDATFPASLADGPVVVADAGDAARSVALRLLPASAPAASTAASSSPAAADSAPTAQTEQSTSLSASAAATVTAAAARATIATAAAATTVVVADEPGTASDNQVTYPDAAGPGLDVAYEAGTDAVKETITLDSPAAAAALATAGGSVSFALTVGKGLTPTLSDTTPGKGPETAGGEQVSVLDAKGATAFTIPPAFMDDAKGAHSDAVSYTLTGDAKTGWTLTLTPDASWLAAPERAYPVVVDPTIEYPSPRLGCALNSAAATTANCGGSTLPISWNSSGGAQQRALLRFDELLNVVPADAQVWTAKLKLHVQGTTAASAATSIDVKELTAPFTNAATWNTRNGSTAWTTPGGDTSADVWARMQVAGGGYRDFDVSALVNRWVEGQSAYNGFALSKTSSVSGGGQVTLSAPNSGNSPSLYLEWNPRTGDRKGNVTPISVDVTDRTSVAVNPATGNASVSTREFTLAGVGLDLDVAHTSNSLNTGSLGPYGNGWSTSLGGLRGTHIRLTDTAAGHARYTDGTGASWMYYRMVDGTYVRPDGLDVDLARDSGADTWTLTDRTSGVVQTFIKISTSSGSQGAYGLSTVRDRNGNQITYTYDASATTSYNGTRILRSVTDTRGRVFTITNPGSFVTAATDAANRSVYYTVGQNNWLTDFKDSAGNTIKYAYDSSNRVTRITSSEGRIVTLAYDANGRVTRLVNSDGNVDGNGNPSGPAWNFTYNNYSRTASGAASTTTVATDPDGNATTYASDGRGRISQVTNPLGKKTATTFTTNDDVATETAATPAAGGGAATLTNTYNSGSWTLASTRLPTGDGETITYGTGARLYDPVTSTDARGVQTTYAYDANGNQTTTTTGSGSTAITTTSLYQGSTDPAYGGTVNCGPTVNGAVTATKTGVVCETRDGAYVAGSSAAATTAHRTAYRYNALGELVSMTPPAPSAQAQQTYLYDSLSRLEQIRDGKGQTTIYGYDALDRRTYVMHPDGSSESFYITADGPLRSHTEYNAAGSATRYTQYNRDNLQRLVGLVAPEGNTFLGYNYLGLLTSYEESGSGGPITYGYNAASQLTWLAEPGGSCSGQNFTSPGAASTKCILFQNNDDGERVTTRYPGGQTLSHTLDDSGRVARILGKGSADNGSTSTTRLDLALSYTDPAAPATAANPAKDSNVITTITDAVASRKTTYTYDALDQLTVANTTAIPGGSSVDYEAFCYDGAGNRTKYYTAAGATCSTTNPAVTYTYDGANAMTDTIAGSGAPSLSGSGFTYDANGNQTASKSLPGRTTTYGDREQATSTTPAGGSSTSSTYASAGNTDRLTSGARTYRTSMLASAPGSVTEAGTTLWTVRDPDGQLLAVRRGSTTSPASASSYYALADQVGSIRSLLTSSGTVANSYSYSSFGILKTITEAIYNPFRFAQGIADTDNFNKLGARYYDAAIGRFTQLDPSGQDPHYSYAAQNPISLVDPTGLHPVKGSCSFPSPSHSGKTSFEPACHAHDHCYAIGSGRTQAQCDSRFYSDLQYACNADRNRQTRAQCLDRARNMYWGVRIGGKNHFNKRRL